MTESSTYQAEILTPSGSADSQDDIEKHIDSELLALYDIYSYRHAAAILKNSFPVEFAQITNALLKFRITQKDIGLPGGNESGIPKKLSIELRPSGWLETKIKGDLAIKLLESNEELKSDGNLRKVALPERQLHTLYNYVDGHKIDYVKGKVAFDMEWNSKDQTYDRDLFAFRMFHECGVISVAVLLTRSEKLNPLFEVIPRLKKDGSLDLKNGNKVPCKSKYGASTTWMGKLIPRLNAGRHGACPVLVVGITPNVVSDWVE